MKVKEVEYKILLDLEKKGIYNTVFTTYKWVTFLKENQNIKPVVLEITDASEEIVGYFVGLIVKKLCVKILGSPFEGWLTPDMGFIRIIEFDINEALRVVAKYAFEKLKCWYVQITDKYIVQDNLSSDIKYELVQMLTIDISKSTENILQNFKKNGRRDVRASCRKGTVVKQVNFDEKFVENYYEQLIEVFAKQSLEPFYDKKKIYDLMKAFQNQRDRVLALEAFNEEGECIATLLSFGLGEWAYYLCAASYRKYQKQLPNEALFWEFVKYWNENGIKNLDLVGYREYKMKYNPKIENVPMIYFEKFSGLKRMKELAKKIIMIIRKSCEIKKNAIKRK